VSTPLRRYYRGHDLVGLRDEVNASTRYYRFDHQGTTQCLTDSTGTVTDRFAADAWGVPVKRTGNSINRHWYIGNWGYYRQADSALDYVRARLYAYTQGAWISQDPLLSDSEKWFFENPAVASLRAYVYAANIPVLWVDSTGRAPHTPPGCCMPPAARGGINGAADAFCDKLKDPNVKASIAKCAASFKQSANAPISLKCLSDWCTQGVFKCEPGILDPCGGIPEIDTVKCKPCADPKTWYDVVIPGVCAVTPGASKGINPKQPIYFCCMHWDWWPKNCKLNWDLGGCNLDEAGCLLYHELAHACSGQGHPPAPLRAFITFANCVKKSLGMDISEPC